MLSCDLKSNSCSVRAKSTPAPVVDSTCMGVKLPKLEVPTFDCNLFIWKQFWGQFCASVHNRTTCLMLKIWSIFKML